jgi:hypothetical protein
VILQENKFVNQSEMMQALAMVSDCLPAAGPCSRSRAGAHKAFDTISDTCYSAACHPGFIDNQTVHLHIFRFSHLQITQNGPGTEEAA